MLISGAASASSDQGSQSGEPAAADRASLLDRALPRGLSLATCVWVVAFVARLPQSSLDSRWLLALLLAVLALGAMTIGWQSRSVAVAAASLLVAGLVNCLLVSSVIHSGDTATQEVSRVTLSDWAWIPGSLVAAGSLVLEGQRIPPRSVVMGSPAKVKRETTDEELERIRRNAESYARLSAEYGRKS